MLKRLLFFLFICLLAHPVEAAIAYDNAASTNGTTATTLTLSSYTIAGSNNYLIVTTGMGAGTVGTTTSVTCNGVDMGSSLLTVVRTGNYRLTFFGKAGCTSGDIVATFSSSSTEIFLGAESWSGVDPTTPVASISCAGANCASGVTPGDTETLTISSASGHVVVDAVFILDTTIAAHTGQTSRFSRSSSTYTLASSSADGASSITMLWDNINSGNDWTAGVIDLLPYTLSPVAATVRHEINILTSTLSALTAVSATSNEQAHLDTTKYGTATYDFEIVADSSSTLSFNVSLRRLGTSTDDCTRNVPLGTLGYTLFTQAGCSLSTNDYVVFIDNSTGATKNVKSAKIIVHDTNPNVSQVQIEIGNNESFTATTPSALAAPKYWKYTSGNWDGSKTFYAEVSYAAGTHTQTDTFTANGSWTCPYAITSFTAKLWGGGAEGSHNGSTSQRPGGGGGGGAFVQKNAATCTAGNSLSITVGVASTAEGTGNSSIVPADSGTLTALGGGGTTDRTGGSGAVASGGDTNRNGGLGATATNSNDNGGAGAGEGACTTGTGNTGSANSGATGGAGGTGCDGGDGGAGGNNSNAGVNGTAPSGGGGGAGGNNNVGGHGARGEVQNSYTSSVKITLQEDNGSFGSWADKITIVSAGVATSSTRVRSSSFTPTDGRHYRIAVVRSDSGISPAIYNAKIIVDQSGTFNKLEEYYQLANTTLAGGTGLQLFLSKWDSAEWSTYSNTYTHVVSSGGGSSIVEADTAGGTTITGSSVTANAVWVESGNLTMPSNGNIDMKAATNNSDVYGDAIVAKVTLLNSASGHLLSSTGAGR